MLWNHCHRQLWGTGARTPVPWNFNNLFSVHFGSAHRECVNVCLTATLCGYLFKHFTVCNSNCCSLMVATRIYFVLFFSYKYFHLGRVLCPHRTKSWQCHCLETLSSYAPGTRHRWSIPVPEWCSQVKSPLGGSRVAGLVVQRTRRDLISFGSESNSLNSRLSRIS